MYNLKSIQAYHRLIKTYFLRIFDMLYIVDFRIKRGSCVYMIML